MSRNALRPIVGICACATLVVVVVVVALAQKPDTQPIAAPPATDDSAPSAAESSAAASPAAAVPTAALKAEVAEIVGRVEAHDNSVLGIVVPADAIPAAGDSFEVFLTTPAGERNRVGRGKLSFAKNGMALGRLEEATGDLALGQEVRIQCVSAPVDTAKHLGMFVGDDAQFPFVLQVETRADMTTVRGLGRVPYSAADPTPILAEFVGISTADAPQSLRGVLTFYPDGERLPEKQRSPWVGLYDPTHDDWQLMLSPKHTVGAARSGASAKSSSTPAQAGAAAVAEPRSSVPLTVGDLAGPAGPVTNVSNPSPLTTQWNQVTTALADLGQRTPAAAKKSSSKDSAADSLEFLERITNAAATGDEDWLDFDYLLLPPLRYEDFRAIESAAIFTVDIQQQQSGRNLTPDQRREAIQRETIARYAAAEANRRTQRDRLLEQEMRDRYGARPVPPSNPTPTGTTRTSPPTATANTTPAPPSAAPSGTVPVVTTSTATGGSSAANNTTPVAPPVPPAPPSQPTLSLDDALAFLGALGISPDRISSVLVPAPDATRAWQVVRINRLPGGRIEIVNYGNAPDGPNVAQGGTAMTGGVSQNTPPNAPPNMPPNSNGGAASTGGANSGNAGSGPTGGTSSPPPGNGDVPRTPDTTSLVNNDGSNRVPGSPPNMPPPSDPGTPPNTPPATPPTTTRTPPPAPPVAPPRTSGSEPIARGATRSGRDSGQVYDPNVTVLVNEDSGQAPTPALTQAQIDAARAALNRNMVAAGVQSLAKGPDAASGSTPPAGGPVKPVEDFNAQPPGGVCHDYVLDRLGITNTSGSTYRSSTDVNRALDSLRYAPATHTGPTDRLPPGTVIQWGADHVGIIGPDGRVHHFTQAAPGQDRPAAVNVSDSIDDVTRTSHTLTDFGTGRSIERRPYENRPVIIRVPPQNGGGTQPLPDWIQRGLTSNVTGRRDNIVRDSNGLRPVQPPSQTSPPTDITSVPATPPTVTPPPVVMPPPVIRTPPPPPPEAIGDGRPGTSRLPSRTSPMVSTPRPTGTPRVYDPNVTVQVNEDSGQAPTPALTQAQINAARAALNRNMVAGGVQMLAKGPKGTDADHHHAPATPAAVQGFQSGDGARIDARFAGAQVAVHNLPGGKYQTIRYHRAVGGVENQHVENWTIMSFPSGKEAQDQFMVAVKGSEGWKDKFESNDDAESLWKTLAKNVTEKSYTFYFQIKLIGKGQFGPAPDEQLTYDRCEVYRDTFVIYYHNYKHMKPVVGEDVSRDGERIIAESKKLIDLRFPPVRNDVRITKSDDKEKNPLDGTWKFVSGTARVAEGFSAQQIISIDGQSVRSVYTQSSPGAAPTESRFSTPYVDGPEKGTYLLQGAGVPKDAEGIIKLSADHSTMTSINAAGYSTTWQRVK